MFTGLSWWLGALVILPFGWAAFRGAPWLPTRRPQARKALDLLDLRPGQTVVDLGSGGGGFLVMAAKSGYKAVGYELNLWLWLYSKLRLWPYRHDVKVYRRSYWRQSLSQYDGVYVFLIERYMKRLEGKLTSELRPGAKVVSYTFKLPRRPEKSTNDGLYLYKY